MSDHIGLIPLVMVSPADTLLIAGGSEERRRFMDVVISQFDREYLDALIRYNKALAQRNTLLKAELEPDEELMNVWEEMMASTGEIVFRKRRQFIDEFIPIFQSYYAYISQNREQVKLSYQSHAAEGDLLTLLRENRQRDRVMGYSLKGIHKDDLIMQLGEFPMKREGSQGQNKTYLIALKLAQFEFLKRTGSGTTPLILLDDIFDKLDALRVEQIVKLVAGDSFGQIFITDTNRDHLDRILKRLRGTISCSRWKTARYQNERKVMKRNNTEQIGDVLRQFLRQQGLETPLNEYRLVDAWKDVVGPVITRYTTNLFIKNQVLYVSLSSSVIRQELMMGREMLIRNLNAQVGSQVIVNIVFR